MLTKLPTRICLTDGGGYLDGGTLVFEATTESGEQVQIRLNQHTLRGTENPGRLFYDGNIVDVRSDYETQLIALMETAEIKLEGGPRPDSTPNYVGPPIEYIERLDDMKTCCIDEFRSSLIDFVRSERYVEISKHGILPNPKP